MSREQYEPAARAAAAKYGVPVDHFLRQITQESNWDPNASSGFASGIAQFTDETARDLGVNPWDPIASLDAAARYMKHLHDAHGSWARAFAAYNWGWGHVLKWDGRRETLPAETAHYLDVILGLGWPEPGTNPASSAPYDSTAPVTQQPNDWACSVYSLLWALHSLGRGTSAAWLQEAMLDQGVVSKKDGLLRGDGSGLVDFVNREYGELGIEAHRMENVTIGDVRAKAGQYPVMLGGHGWGSAGHWVGVRGVQPDGTLNLANPADGYDGIHQELRDSFGRLGPFTMVWLEPKDGVIVDPEPPPHPDTDLVTSLKTALAEVTHGAPYQALGDLQGKPLKEVLTQVDNIRNRLTEIGNQYGV